MDADLGSDYMAELQALLGHHKAAFYERSAIVVYLLDPTPSSILSQLR